MNKREEILERIKTVLLENNIRMDVGGCGCCGSPWISFEYKGETITSELDCANLTMIGIFQPVLSDEEWAEHKLASFQVYSSKEKALEDWPNHEIKEFCLDEIEDYHIIK